MPSSEMQLNLSSQAADPEAQAWLAQRRQRLWRARLLPVLGVAGLLFTWWAVVAGFHVKPFIAPSPFLVLETLFNKSDVLLQNLVPTAIEAVGGFLLGNLAAILIATVFVHNKTLQDIFYPVAVMINSIPVVAKAPILVLIMGNGLEPKITIAAIVCFFPTLVNMVRGLQAVNPQAMELRHESGEKPKKLCGLIVMVQRWLPTLRIAESAV